MHEDEVVKLDVRLGQACSAESNNFLFYERLRFVMDFQEISGLFLTPQTRIWGRGGFNLTKTES